MNPRFVIVSNGHGEDAIGARLARALAQEFGRAGLELDMLALPLVGRGAAYERTKVRILGPRRELPSGGFMWASPQLFYRDLRAGFLAMSRDQFRTLRQAKVSGVLVVGDIYALWVALQFACARDVFQVQPLVSAHYAKGMTVADRAQRWNRVTVDFFTWPERLMMRRLRRVFVRDREGMDVLRQGWPPVPQACWLGNPIMDELAPECELVLAPDQPVLALLPGTRADFRFSLPLMLETSECLAEFQSLVASPLKKTVLLETSLPPGWSWRDPTMSDETLVAVHRSGKRVPITKAFAALLSQARAALGTSGTANEQAAGLGIPVIGFPTPGPQYLLPFARAQKRLLGDALTLARPLPSRLAELVRLLASDGDMRTRAQLAGCARIGAAGASERIARQMLEDLLGSRDNLPRSERAPRR